MGHIILIVSVVVQLLAALVALWLAARRPSRAWYLVATAIGLMAVRRGFTLAGALDADRAIDPGAEAIALLISALMLVGLIGLLRRLGRSEAGDMVGQLPEFSHRRLGTTAMTVGLLAAIGSAVVGLYAYRASSTVVIRGIHRNMLILAQSLGELAGSHVEGGDIDGAIATLRAHWKAFGRAESQSELCIARRGGEVVLSTASPESEGELIPDLTLTLIGGDEVSVAELARQRKNATGWATIPDGRRQIVAIAYVETLDCLVCLHVPASEVEDDIRAATIPWAVALALTTVILLPVSLVLFHRAYSASQRLIEDKNRQLAEREQRLRQIVEHMPVMMEALDDKGNIVVWNRECERVTGYAADEIIGNAKAWEMLYPDADYRNRMLEELRRRDDDYRDWEWEATCKDGKVRRIAWSNCSMMFPIPGWSGWRIGVDMTERREAELAARSSMAQLARLGRLRSLGEMASGIAHELNQPLTAIVNYAQGGMRRLEDGVVDVATFQPALREISGQALRAADIIKRLRGFVGSGLPRREPADLNEIVRTVVDLFEPESHLRDLDVSLTLCSSLPPVMVERVQIQQVLVNLMQNAVDAMHHLEPRDRRLEIATALVPDTFVEVSVRDFGRGLDAKDLKFALDPFFTTQAGVLGMGLAISRSIIAAHDGTLSVDRNCEVGAVFRFRLPAMSRSE